MTKYLFIDGGCLRARVAELSTRYWNGGELSINWWSLSGGFRKVFYYDAIPCRRPKQTEEEYNAEREKVIQLHAALATFDRFRVNEGDTRYSKGRGLEQKKVDVMIAVDMMIHTIRRNMEEASLLAGDADFTPLLNALSNEGMFVELIHPPRASKDLLAAADARRAMTVREVYGWLDANSKANLGAFPVPSWSSHAHDANCVLIWAEKSAATEGVSVWHQLVDDTIWVAWPEKGRSNLFCLRGGNWKNTRLLALDDYGVELPSDLPPEFHHL